MKRLFVITAIISLLAVGGVCTPAKAEPGVGSMVALRGDTNILRETATLKAVVKDPVMLKDLIETMERSRAKVLFVDESMLTIGPKSKASVEKFVYSREEGGASIFNLLDGTMRAVVGKTAFEVHTPTTVAAARGTVIEFTVGKTEDGRYYTIIVCLEGSVLIKSSDPNIEGAVTVNAGETITVFEGETLPIPSIASTIPPPEPGPEDSYQRVEVTEEIFTPTVQILPPIEQEPSATSTPVTINVQFPD